MRGQVLKSEFLMRSQDRRMVRAGAGSRAQRATLLGSPIKRIESRAKNSLFKTPRPPCDDSRDREKEHLSRRPRSVRLREATLPTPAENQGVGKGTPLRSCVSLSTFHRYGLRQACIPLHRGYYLLMLCLMDPPIRCTPGGRSWTCDKRFRKASPIFANCRSD